jgi:hypothetical protein
MGYLIGNLLLPDLNTHPRCNKYWHRGISIHFLFQDVNACYNIESIYLSLRDFGRRPPVFGPPAVDEER